MIDLIAVAVTPGATEADTAANIVAAVNTAATASGAPIGSLSNVGDTLTVTGSNASRGEPLIFTISAGTLTFVETAQEPYREIFRDLKLETLSIRVETRADDPPPPIEETAWQLAEKVLTRFSRPGAIEDLKAVCIGFANGNGPIATSMLSGGSQGVEVATITVSLNVTIESTEAVGTIEAFEAAATIDAEGGALSASVNTP